MDNTKSDRGAFPQNRQTTPHQPRPRPKSLTITEAQAKEAFGLYLDYMFDAPHGTYKVNEWNVNFGTFELFMEQE